MDIDEAVMLIRAVLASKKGPTSIKELSGEYYECNGTHIPYKNFGFDSLIKFLECHRDKFEIFKDHMTGEYQIKVVVDKNISDLRRLVTGQKSSGKKKSSHVVKRPMPIMTKNKTFFRPSPGKPKQLARTVHNDHYYHPPHPHREIHITSKGPHAKPAKKSDAKSIHNQIKANVPKNLHVEMKSAPAPTMITKTTFEKKINDEIDKENLWITNASYFLKEHDVFVSYVEDCSKFYIRLIGPDFSEEYAKLIQELNIFYSEKGHLCRMSEVRANDFCVISNKYHFFRAQVKKVNTNMTIECFLVDEGETNVYEKKDVYRIEDKFLKLKFQAIPVEIENFDYFYKNDFLFEQVQLAFIKHQYIARRVQVNPLVVALYFKSKPAESVSKKFMDKYKYFCVYKLVKDCTFTTFITYICDETSLVHLRNPLLNLEFDEWALKVNEYLSNMNAELFKILNETTRKKLSDDSYVKSKLFCAKYHIDSRWYRVKFIKLTTDKETKEPMALVMYVDFGNKELVSLQDLIIFPNEYALFKNMPPQSFPVTLFNDSIDMTILKELWYENKPLDFTVIKFNSVGIATVKIGDQLLKQYKQTMERGELTQSFKNLTLEEVRENPDEIKNILYKDLAVVDFPVCASVYIRYVNNPSDFVINLESQQNEYQTLLQEMKIFYDKRSKDYTVKKLNKEFIYVCRLDSSDYIRVKFVENVIGDHVKIYDIDAGNFDAVKASCLFHITTRFLKTKPQAIKAQLANVNYDLNDKWSEPARSHFIKLLDKKKTYKAVVVKFSAQTDYFQIELIDSNSIPLSSLMICAGFTNKIN